MHFKTRTQNKLFITIISMFLVLLIFPTLAHAEMQVNTYSANTDFSVMSKYSSVEICSCSTKYDSIVVTNTGTWTAIFTVATESNSNKITLSEQSFELAPQSSKEVFLYITSECNEGIENIKINVASNLGKIKFLEKEIIMTKCQNIESWLTNYTKNINPCESKNFEINIHNVGPFSETYTINSNYDSYIAYNTKTVNLEPNQYAQIKATLKLGCEIYGQKDVSFDVKSVKNKLTAKLDAQVNIIQNYNYEIKVNNNLVNDNNTNTINTQVCNRISSTLIPVSITNTGSVTNEYNVDVSSLPKNAKITGLENTKLTINPGNTKTFTIEVDSTNYRYEYKNKKVNIEITPKLGNINKQLEVSLNFMPCYEHQLILYGYGNNEKNPLRTCEDYDYSYNINLINNGLFKEKYKLELLDSPSSIKLAKTTVELSPKDNTIIPILITGPNTNKDYKILVKVTSSIGISEYAEVWIKSYDTQSCHNTIITKDQYKANYQTEYITVPVTNKGLVETSYIISWNGSDIITSDIILITINNSKSRNIVLKTDSLNKAEGNYNGQIILQTSYGAEYTKDITIALKDKSFVRKAFEYLAFGNTCKQFSLYSVAIIILLIILIFIILVRGPNYPYKFKNRLKSKVPVMIFLMALFLVGVILVIIVAGLPKNEAQVYNLTTNNSELTYEWLQDDKYTLDVSKLFYDPENSTLNYKVTGIKNIKAIVKDQTITFYPNKGWSGTERAVITAYDAIGDKATSPRFTLIVKDVPRKSIVELYNIYCWYTNLIIYALILLLVFAAVFVRQKKRGRK